MITSSIRVACLNCQFWGTHKFLRVHHVWEDTSQSEACGSQSCVHAPLQQVLVTVSPTKTNAHAHPSLRSHPSGHGEFNITSLTSGQCCLSSSTSLARCPLCSNIASDRVPAAGSCEAYNTTYCPLIFLRCAVVLVSAVLYPRTIRQAYSCATGRAISLTAYTVNSLHQTLHWVSLCRDTPVTTDHLRTVPCTSYEHGQGKIWPVVASRDIFRAHGSTRKSSLPSRELSLLSATALGLFVDPVLGMLPNGMVGVTGSRRMGAGPDSRSDHYQFHT